MGQGDTPTDLIHRMGRGSLVAEALRDVTTVGSNLDTSVSTPTGGAPFTPVVEGTGGGVDINALGLRGTEGLSPADATRVREIDGSIQEMTEAMTEASNFELPQENKYNRIMSRIFNPRYKQERALKEFEMKMGMMSRIGQASAQLMQERRLLTDPDDPYGDEIKKWQAKMFGDQYETAQRAEQMKGLQGSGIIDLTSEQQAEYVLTGKWPGEESDDDPLKTLKSYTSLLGSGVDPKMLHGDDPKVNAALDTMARDIKTQKFNVAGLMGGARANLGIATSGPWAGHKNLASLAGSVDSTMSQIMRDSEKAEKVWIENKNYDPSVSKLMGGADKWVSVTERVPKIEQEEAYRMALARHPGAEEYLPSELGGEPPEYEIPTIQQGLVVKPKRDSDGE